jgi:transposase
VFIKRTTRRYKDKTYTNHLLVESVSTASGPRHRVVCSLGRLDPGPPDQWLSLARKIEAALAGQGELVPDEQVDSIVARARGTKTGGKRRGPQRPASAESSDLVRVHTDRVQVEHVREAGPVHVGHQMWQKLEVDAVLAKAGLSPRARLLTEVMTLNRLVHPTSEHAMPDWIRRTALEDILKTSFETLADDALYRNLDALHPKRETIEGGLAEREKTLFNLDDSIYLYDLTSTYFEGQCPFNPQAKFGYSRDKRPDCKQVVVGLVLDREGFPKAHEVFDGNRTDRTTVDEMLSALERRVGKKGKPTVVVDRGMAFDDNLEQIKNHGDGGYHYIVACRQAERKEHFDELEDEEGWTEVVRKPSPRNPCQKKTRVQIKRSMVGDELHVLCRSDGREKKDRAIREKQEKRLLADLKKLQKRIDNGRLRKEGKVGEAIGRIKERYSRVARYYAIDYDAEKGVLTFVENADKKERAKQTDGTYLMKTDRKDLSDEEVWRIYMLLTRVESAFRSMKSPLAERPIFHHLERRVQTHIFLCVLAYHLLVSVEKMFLDEGFHTSWATLREQLRTHQVVTVVLPAQDGKALTIRKGSTPEPTHKEIYRTLRIPEEVMKPVKTWRAG